MQKTQGRQSIQLDAPDVALADHHTGHVDRLGEASLEHLGLEAALEDLLGGQLQHEVKLALLLGQQTVADQAAHEGLTLEDAGLVLLVEGQQDTGGLADLREHELGAPDLALGAEAILTTQLELLVKALLAERAARGLVGLAEVTAAGGRDHVGCIDRTQHARGTQQNTSTDKMENKSKHKLVSLLVDGCW